jgi:hypothetical protein
MRPSFESIISCYGCKNISVVNYMWIPVIDVCTLQQQEKSTALQRFASKSYIFQLLNETSITGYAAHHILLPSLFISIAQDVCDRVTCPPMELVFPGRVQYFLTPSGEKLSSLELNFSLRVSFKLCVVRGRIVPHRKLRLICTEWAKPRKLFQISDLSPINLQFFTTLINQNYKYTCILYVYLLTHDRITTVLWLSINITCNIHVNVTILQRCWWDKPVSTVAKRRRENCITSCGIYFVRCVG